MGLVTIKAPIGSELTISGNVPDHKMSSGQLDNGADLSASPSTITVDEDKEINFGFSKDETEQPIYP